MLRIRADHVVLEHRFFDQDDKLVKVLRTLEVAEKGGRTIAARQRMGDVDAPDEWTEVRIDAVEYDVDIGDNIFTLSNLRNPRE